MGNRRLFLEEGRGANLLSNLFLREFRRFVCLDFCEKKRESNLKKKGKFFADAKIFFIYIKAYGII